MSEGFPIGFVVIAVGVIAALLLVPNIFPFLGIGDTGSAPDPAERFSLELLDFTAGGWWCVGSLDTIEVEWTNSTGTHWLNTTGADWANPQAGRLVLSDAAMIGQKVESVQIFVDFFLPSETFSQEFQLNYNGQLFSGSLDYCDDP